MLSKVHESCFLTSEAIHGQTSRTLQKADERDDSAVTNARHTYTALVNPPLDVKVPYPRLLGLACSERAATPRVVSSSWDSGPASLASLKRRFGSVA